MASWSGDFGDIASRIKACHDNYLHCPVQHCSKLHDNITREQSETLLGSLEESLEVQVSELSKVAREAGKVDDSVIICCSTAC